MRAFRRKKEFVFFYYLPTRRLFTAVRFVRDFVKGVIPDLRNLIFCSRAKNEQIGALKFMIGRFLFNGKPDALVKDEIITQQKPD